MKQCYWILNPIEVKSVYYFLFEANVKLVSRNMKLHNVSHEGTLSQYMSTLSCIPFILMTINMSCSCHQVTLPSQLSGRFCIKKKNDKRSFSSLINFTEFRPLYICYDSVSSGEICQNRIAGIGLFKLSRSRSFFFLVLSWLFISSECFMIRNKPLYYYFLRP